MEKIRMPYLFMWPEMNLDTTVHCLQAAKSDKFNYYYDFLGHVLESDTVTLEDAYLEVYGMTRAEYRTRLKESYQRYCKNLEEQFRIRQEEDQKRRQKVFDTAKGIIPEDKMGVYEEAYDLLSIIRLLDDNIHLEFLDFIKFLNSSEYTLQQALEKYKRFMASNIFSNADLLKCIRDLSVHGSELYDALVDEETTKRLKDNLFFKGNHDLSRILEIDKPKEPTEDDLLTSYDIKMTTYALIGYHSSQEKKSEKTPEGFGLK